MLFRSYGKKSLIECIQKNCHSNLYSDSNLELGISIFTWILALTFTYYLLHDYATINFNFSNNNNNNYSHYTEGGEYYSLN